MSRALRAPRVWTLAVAAAVAVAAVLGLASSAASAPGGKHPYIVQLADPPAVAYEGGLQGLAATAPKGNRKLDPNDANVKRYVAHLNGKQNALAARFGVDKYYDYAVAFNGFAALMTASQAAKLEATAGVVAVTKDRLAKVATSSTPRFLGLTGSSGLWSKLGGAGSAGENVVVGILDTGIWPEHPSFSDQTDRAFRPGATGKRSYAYGPVPSDWRGTCQSGEQWSQGHCGRKLIGARYFLRGFGQFGVVQSDFLSPRDADDHGSHTASTAAGNADVPATGAAAPLGSISGMAPRARIAAYKICWNGDAGGCANSDSVAAIDAAVADGVDVINFSIGGTSTNYLHPVEVAFLYARRAGVFVATSAGNSGPGSETVSHISPWLTSVAASTHDRPAAGVVTLGDGSTHEGSSSLTEPLASKPLVLASAAGLAGAPEEQVELCYPGTLDATKVSGRIVVCDRGVIDRVHKSLAVMQAGGAGLVLANTSENSLNADLHYVPTVHVDHVAGEAIKAYVASAGVGATASLAPSATVTPAPAIAAFSSRGPSLAGDGDVLKPDLSAPGVDVLAAVSPSAGGRSFDLASGTSMSSPHVAGLAALLRQSHPTWSPAAIQSALMTTGYDLVSGPDPLAQGAGHVDPTSADEPGLVYDSGYTDYLRFLQGQNCGCLPASYPKIEARDLNLASIAVGSLAGSQTVTRKVKNVGTEEATYTSSVTGLAGFDVTVTPSTLTIAPGATETFTVRIDRTTADVDAYASGFLTWTDGTHTVRSPIAVRPVAIAVPRTASGTGESGSLDLPVTFGYTGAFSAAMHGLVASTTEDGSVDDDPTNEFTTAPAGSVQVHTVAVPADTSVARFQTFGTNHAGDDIDMFVYRLDADDEKTLVGQSTSSTSAEVVTLTAPAAATYEVHVHGWQVVSPALYTLHSWTVPAADAGNTTVTAPASATTGGTGTVTAAWAGLTPGARYLGRLVYSDGSGPIGATLLRVDA